MNTNTKTLEYGIDKADAHLIFSLLRSKIYSDPIGSICREIASNSRDANREAKNNKPIEIAFEIVNNSTQIVFKDEGVGISTTRMSDVFCKYASSTKRQSDNLTGGFGLGAKTPFAYTDKFYVITNFRGKKYHYTCALTNANGTITLDKEEATKEHNGTEIRIPIKNFDDVYNFERKVVYYTQFWNPRPVLKNFTHFNYEDVVYSAGYGTDTAKILNKPENYGEMIALVDEIPYKVDVSKLGIDHSNMLDGKTLAFMFKKNEVSVSANRETLYFDDETTKTLNQKFKDTTRIFDKQFKEYLHSGDYLEYCVKANSMFYPSEPKHYEDLNLFKMICRNTHNANFWDKTIESYMPDYKDGRKLTKTISLTGKGVIIEKVAQKKISATEAKTTYTLDGKYKDKTIYWLDESRRSAERNLTLVNNHGHFMLLTHMKNKDEKETYDSFFKSIRYLIKLGFDVVRYSSVEKTKIEKQKREKKETTIDLITGLCLSGFRNRWDVRVPFKIQVDKETKKLINAVKGKMNDTMSMTIPTYVIEVDKLTDLKNNNALLEKMGKYVFASSHMKNINMLIVNKQGKEKLVKYFSSIKTNIDDIFYEKEVDEALTRYVLRNESDGIKNSIRSLFSGQNGYGYSVDVFNFTDEGFEILGQIFDLDETMMVNIKEGIKIVKEYNNGYYSSRSDVDADVILAHHRPDLLNKKVSINIDDAKKHIADIIKRKPLLGSLGVFSNNVQLLEEFKKYSYACDVLFL